MIDLSFKTFVKLNEKLP